MSISEPGKLITPWAESGLKNEIPQAASSVTGRAGFDQGFPAINMTPKEEGGIPPFGQDFNGIFYEITKILQYMQAGGQPTFDADFAAAIGGYPAGAILSSDDGMSLFRNTVDGNSTNPNLGGDGWARPDLQIMELYRRSYAEAGYNVVGTFQAGFTIASSSDIGIDLATGKGYAGPIGPVAARTNPSNGGFVDRSREIKSNFEYSGSALESLASPVEYINSVVDFKRTKINVSVNQALRLSGGASIRDGVIYPTIAYSVMGTISGEHNDIRNMFIEGIGNSRFTNVHLIEDAKYLRISGNRYKDQQYQIIQQSRKYANSVIVTENVSTGGIGDFVLANNDFQQGISYDWNASNNIVDQTDSATAYGVTECRGIGFTSVYGARAVNNSMIGVRGDAASHVENVQESVFAFNYYRDCFKDFLFSGTASRRWLRLTGLTGAFQIGSTVTGSTSGATASVLFSYGPGGGSSVFITPISGSFQKGEQVTSGGVSGTVAFIDQIKTHSNLIGNIFHKSPTGTTLESVNLGVNNYNLCTSLIGNSWLNEMSLGSGTRAVNGAFASNVKQALGTYRGWDTAIGGGSTVSTDYVENFFASNTNHIDLSSLTKSRLSGNRFIDGQVTIATSTKVTYADNIFDTGSSVSITAGGGNIWKNNRIATGVTVTAALERFEIFESLFVNKRNNLIKLTPTIRTVNPSVPYTVATASPAANNVSAVVDYRTVWRNTNTLQRGASRGSVLLAWDGTGTLSVTEIVAPTDNKGRVSFVIAGTNVDIKLTSDTTGSTLISSEIDILVNGVNVSPVEMFDTL